MSFAWRSIDRKLTASSVDVRRRNWPDFRPMSIGALLSNWASAYRPRWSQSYYHDHLKQFYSDSVAAKDDDGLTHLTEAPARNWDKRIEEIAIDGHLLFDQELRLHKLLDFDLTAAEARYLRDRFQSLAGDNPSLLLHLVKLGHQGRFSYPWDVPCPEGLHRAVHHAERLSTFAKGATLLYYQMLVEARAAVGIAPPDYDLLEPFSLWWAYAKDAISSWDLTEFFQFMLGLGAVRPRDGEFFNQWRAAIVQSNNASELLHGDEGRRVVRAREKAKRPRKARLAGGDHLRNWEPPDSLEAPEFVDPVHVRYWLNYRSGIGQTFVREIVQGIRRKSGDV